MPVLPPNMDPGLWAAIQAYSGGGSFAPPGGPGGFGGPTATVGGIPGGGPSSMTGGGLRAPGVSPLLPMSGGGLLGPGVMQEGGVRGPGFGPQGPGGLISTQPGFFGPDPQPMPSGPIWGGFPPTGGMPQAPGGRSFADPPRMYQARPEQPFSPRETSPEQAAAAQRRQSGGSLARMQARRAGPQAPPTQTSPQAPAPQGPAPVKPQMQGPPIIVNPGPQTPQTSGQTSGLVDPSQQRRRPAPAPTKPQNPAVAYDSFLTRALG